MIVGLYIALIFLYQTLVHILLELLLFNNHLQKLLILSFCYLEFVIELKDQ